MAKTGTLLWRPVGGRSGEYRLRRRMDMRVAVCRHADGDGYTAWVPCAGMVAGETEEELMENVQDIWRRSHNEIICRMATRRIRSANAEHEGRRLTWADLPMPRRIGYDPGSTDWRRG